MGPFLAQREVNGVPFIGIFLEGLHLYGFVFREFTTIWVHSFIHHESRDRTP